MTSEEFKTIGNALTWTFAKTMPDSPHEYIVRNKTVDDDTYIKMFKTIEEHGIWKSWNNVAYQYFFPGDGYYYWKMTDDITESIIINRAREEDFGK